MEREPINGERIGRFIARLRRERGMTQRELAERLHLTDKAVSKWERGLSCPDITLLPALARLLGVTEGELLKGERETAARPAPPEDAPTPENQPEPPEERVFLPEPAVKKPLRWRFIWAAGLTLALAAGAGACLICDWAINGGLTWAPIPLYAMGFGWLTGMPALLARRRCFLAGLISFSLLLMPFLVLLNRQLPVDILPIARPMAALGMAFLWACAGAAAGSRGRLVRAAGWICLLAVPMQLAVNLRLEKLLAEPADPVWTAVSCLVLAGTGAGLLLWEKGRA